MIRQIAVACAAFVAVPAIAQDGPPDRGARIEMEIPGGGEISLSCGRSDISDCAAAARDLIDAAIAARRESGPGRPGRGTGERADRQSQGDRPPQAGGEQPPSPGNGRQRSAPEDGGDRNGPPAQSRDNDV